MSNVGLKATKGAAVPAGPAQARINTVHEKTLDFSRSSRALFSVFSHFFFSSVSCRALCLSFLSLSGAGAANNSTGAADNSTGAADNSIGAADNNTGATDNTTGATDNSTGATGARADADAGAGRQSNTFVAEQVWWPRPAWAST